MVFRRESKATWVVRQGFLSKSWTLVNGRKHLFEVPDNVFRAMAPEQMRMARRIGRDDAGRHWWMYKDEIFVEDESLTADDATALAESDRARRERRVEAAHLSRHASASPGPGPRRSIPVEVRNAVWRRDQGQCVVCGSRADLQFDHIIPLSHGGSSGERNLQLLCGGCNRRKGATLG